MTGNIPSSYKYKTSEKTLIEDVEDELYELPDSDFVRSAARVFYKIDHSHCGVLP